MKISVFILLQLICATALAQQSFYIKDASKYFDIKITADKCLEDRCLGNVSYSFYKKDGKEPYQTITIPADKEVTDYACVYLDNTHQPFVSKFGYVDDQGAINVGDYNFDGMEDVAICRGPGQYFMPAYNVYLSSRTAKQFVYDKDFSKLNSLGMFDVDPVKKTLRTISKSGCCWHSIETYSIVGNKPRKILEVIEDATIDDTTKMKVTTKTLVNGKWQTRVQLVPRPE